MSAKKTVLVVEDDQALMNVYEQLLEHNGYKVLSALTGEEGLELYKSKDDINAVILDMVLPGISGEEVLEVIQKTDINQAVIICSGYDVATEFSGNIQHLKKPFPTPVLLELLENACATKE